MRDSLRAQPRGRSEAAPRRAVSARRHGSHAAA
jgi:hypothetical protein